MPGGLLPAATCPTMMCRRRCHCSRSLLLLLLQQTVYLEPIRASTIARTAFGHAHHQTLAQSTCLAGRAILLVDNAFAIVLAIGDGGEIVVGAAEK